MTADTKKRCFWCNLQNPLYVDYHDKEWGVPVHDDQKLFEMLLLESFQAGLSWECILNKREAFRKAFDGFNYRLIAAYEEKKQEALKHDAGIIRNKLKIKAAVNNAKVFIDIQKEFGSFDQYIWGFTNGEIIHEKHLTSSPLSDKISKDLYRRGMRFVGTTIIYSYLQAIGIIFSHDDDCFLSQKTKEEMTNGFRKATKKDIERIADIYNNVLDLEEEGKACIGWQRGVYPTKDTAQLALERGDLFVYEDEKGEVQASAIINHKQMESYAKGNWKTTTKDDDEVMVLHTLVVDPDCSCKGIGKAFVAFYEQYAKAHGCIDLRMDTQAKNHVARNLYHKLGYEEIGIVPCDFNGIKGISLVLLEKNIE